MEKTGEEDLLTTIPLKTSNYIYRKLTDCWEHDIALKFISQHLIQKKRRKIKSAILDFPNTNHLKRAKSTALLAVWSTWLLLGAGEGWVQREGWARGFTWLAYGLCPHSDTYLGCRCTFLQHPLGRPLFKEPHYTLPIPCSRCTAFLHMASQADPRDTSAPKGDLPFMASRGGAVQSPGTILTADTLLPACLTPSPLSRVPWPRLPHSSEQPSGGSGVLRVCVTWSLQDLSGSSESSVFLSCYIDS